MRGFADSGSLEDALDGLRDQWDVDRLSEPILPDAARGPARAAPAIHDLGGRRGLRDDLGDDPIACPEEERRAAVAAVALVGRAGPPDAHVAEDSESVVGRRGAEGCDRSSDRAREIR